MPPFSEYTDRFVMAGFGLAPLGFVLVGFTVLALLRVIGDLWKARKEEPVIKLKEVEEDKIDRFRGYLLAHHPYYVRLPEELKDKFMERTIRFMRKKRFHFIEMEPVEKAPLLISAVAVQITFGLDEYEMNYFRDIYILRTNYHFGLSAIPYEGHVNSEGIYLSWYNFEKSFEDYADGNNVGLHEMAHALAYVNFTARVGEDDHFRSRFKEFSKTGRRIFNEMQAGRLNLLGSYAATNYNEFWAVCIENFFERPRHLKNELPDLYFEMIMLLNQDPLSSNLLIDNIERA